MRRLSQSFALGIAAALATLASTRSAHALEAVTSFGSNPGNLLMYRYVPQGVAANAPLVVALHGCTQTADQMTGTGWNALADKYKFYVAYAQQQSANNPVQCFDWWGQYNNPANKANITRGQGENASIKQMVDKMKADFGIDPGRVFVVGFSSGAAMAAVMLAAWPDVFAAGGIAAGVPYNCPSTTNSDVWQCMSPGKTQTADQWGTLVKNAYPGYAGAWPRVTIWQGSQDTTVATANESELVKQWTDVHGISATPTTSDTVATYPHDVFKDGSGRVVVEKYVITGMDHAYAIDPSNGCGTAAQYIEDKKICTALYMAQFFGITQPLDPGDGGVEGGTTDAGTNGDAASEGGSGSGSGGGSGSGSGSGGGSGSGSGSSSGGGSGSGSGSSSGSGGGGSGAGADASAEAPSDSGGGMAGCDVSARSAPAAASIVLLGIALLARRRRTR
jgi:poly(hydroxyalkanoate) depolymerase family esterase